MANVEGGGYIVQRDKSKPKSKCRKWELRVPVGLDPRTGKYKTKSRRFNGTYTEAKREIPLLQARAAKVVSPISPDRARFNLLLGDAITSIDAAVASAVALWPSTERLRADVISIKTKLDALREELFGDAEPHAFDIGNKRLCIIGNITDDAGAVPVIMSRQNVHQ